MDEVPPYMLVHYCWIADFIVTCNTKKWLHYNNMKWSCQSVHWVPLKLCKSPTEEKTVSGTVWRRQSYQSSDPNQHMSYRTSGAHGASLNNRNEFSTSNYLPSIWQAPSRSVQFSAHDRSLYWLTYCELDTWICLETSSTFSVSRDVEPLSTKRNALKLGSCWSCSPPALFAFAHSLWYVYSCCCYAVRNSRQGHLLLRRSAVLNNNCYLHPASCFRSNLLHDLYSLWLFFSFEVSVQVSMLCCCHALTPQGVVGLVPMLVAQEKRWSRY
jgi:hypothetical protein